MELVIDLQDVDKVIVQELYREAEQRNMSINSFVLHLVRSGLAVLQKKSQLQVYHDLDDLAGTWSDEEAALFESAVADFENIDKGLWL